MKRASYTRPFLPSKPFIPFEFQSSSFYLIYPEGSPLSRQFYADEVPKRVPRAEVRMLCVAVVGQQVHVYLKLTRHLDIRSAVFTIPSSDSMIVPSSVASARAWYKLADVFWSDPDRLEVGPTRFTQQAVDQCLYARAWYSRRVEKEALLRAQQILLESTNQSLTD